MGAGIFSSFKHFAMAPNDIPESLNLNIRLMMGLVSSSGGFYLPGLSESHRAGTSP